MALTLDVSGLVDTVDVAETGSDGEEGRNCGQLLVDVVDVLGLSVEGVVVNILVVDTVLLTSCDTNLHLNHLLDCCGALEVLFGGGWNQVSICQFEGFFTPLWAYLPMFHSLDSSERSDKCVSRGGQKDNTTPLTNHVRAEKRLSVLLEVGLVGVHHAVQPGEELLGAVVGVENNGDAVGWGNGSDVVSGSNATGDAGLLIGVGNALACKVRGTCWERQLARVSCGGSAGLPYLHCSAAG